MCLKDLFLASDLSPPLLPLNSSFPVLENAYGLDYSQVPDTVVTHRNRISRKAAAAIAAERNRQSSVDVLGGARDTDYLVESDMMVVYNERTAL